MKNIVKIIKGLFKKPPTNLDASQVRLDCNLFIKTRVVGDEEWTEHARTKNIVPATGRDIIKQLLGRGTPGCGAGYAPTHIALGTGSTTPADGDTTLETEEYRDAITTRQSGTNKIIYQLFLDTGDGNGGGSVTYAEAGLFDNSVENNGYMLARATYTSIAKTSAIQLVFTWEINIASS